MTQTGNRSQRSPAHASQAAPAGPVTANERPPLLPAVTFALDRKGRFSQYNQGSVPSASFTAATVLGRHYSEIAANAGISDAEALYSQLAQGHTVGFPISFGSRQFVGRVAPVHGAQPDGQAAVGVILEITGVPLLRDPGSAEQDALRAIIENIEDGYYEIDLTGRFTVINQTLAEIMGVQHSALLHGDVIHFENFTDPQQARMARRAFRQVLRTGQPVQSMEGFVTRPDGSERFIDFSISLLRTATGRPCGYRGIVRDATIRRMIEQALSERIRLLSLLQGVDDELNLTLDLDQAALIGLDNAMRLSGADAGFIGLLEGDPAHMRVLRAVGVPEHSAAQRTLPVDVGVVGRTIRLAQPQYVPDVSADPDYVPDVAETRSEIAIPLITHERLLGVINLETAQPSRFTPTVFEFAQILGARTAAAIENARLYALSQSQLEQMRELEQLKTDMIRIASHDLRSPLGIIFGYLDILSFDLDSMLNDEQRGYFDAMRRAAERIQRMSTEILSLERVNALRNLPRALVNLNDLALQAVMDHRDAAQQKHITLITQFGERMHVLADPASLPEAMSNLIGNAVKYTPEGGFVTVMLRAAGSVAEFEVSDTGIGIREEDQGRLFEPFYRVRSDESARIDGTGLGLYLVKRIIEQHNGTLHFSSVFGKGSHFGFRIPLAQPPEAAEHA